MITTRCSRLPLNVECAPSIVPPAIRIEPPREMSDLGLAFHDCMKQIAKSRTYDIELAASAFNVDAGELAPLVGSAAKHWRETLSPLFPNPRVEESLSFSDGDLAVTGTPDVRAIADGEIRLLDYKSGFLDLDARPQLKGYAVLSLYESQARLPVRATKFNVRDGRLETDLWTPEQLDHWWAWLKQHLQDTDIYRPGEHCGRCPRAMECNAHGEQMTTLVAMLGGDLPIGDMAETAAHTVQQVRLLERRCEQFRETVKAEVVAKGGRWGALYIKETHPKEISVARGQQVLIETLGTDRLLQLVEIGNKKLETALREKAPPRGGAALIRDTFARLDAAGAITTTTTKRLEVTRNGTTENGTPAIGAAENAG